MIMSENICEMIWVVYAIGRCQLYQRGVYRLRLHLS